MKKNETLSVQENPVRGVLLTVAEVSMKYRLGKTTLYDCARKGEIRYFRPKRGKLLFDSADLDDFMRMSEVPVGTVPEV